MIQKPQFPSSDNKKIYDFNTLDIRNILEEVSRPILLINNNNGQVISANYLFSELVQMGIVEISGLKISELIPLFDLEKINDGEKTDVTISLKNDQTLNVEMNSRFISQTENLLLLLFNKRDNKKIEIGNSWEEFSMNQAAIIKQIYEISYFDLLNEIIIIGKQFTNSDEVVFYVTQQDNSSLKRFPSVSQFFPDQVPALELSRIKEIDFWEPGKRVLSEIHRVGRLKKFCSIISIPVSCEGQQFGLIIATSRDTGNIKTNKSVIEKYALWVSSTIELYKKVQKGSFDLLDIGTKAEKLELFFNNSTDCFLLVDWKNQILEFNSNFLMLLDYLPIELLNKKAEIIFDNPALMSMLIMQPAQDIEPEEKLIEIYDRHGKKKFVYAKVVLSGQGDEEQKMIIIKDATEFNALENNLMVFQKNAALGEVLAEFAHDVRNIINRITTGLQFLVKKLNPDEAALSSFQDLQNECIEMTDLMESVLSFSRQNYEKFKSENIKEMIERIFFRFQKKAEQSNISLILNQINGEFLAWSDQRSLERVINNLINNGIDAIGSEGGAVSVNLSDSEENPGYLLIQIADTGPGVPPDIQSNLYQKYSSGKPEGTGLGLFISRKIIEYHRGWINLETFPGGTIINIQIPKEKQGDAR